jgi:hypothetical protein
MCGSKHECELWERERIEREPEAERLRWISATEPEVDEPQPEETQESEAELVRS